MAQVARDAGLSRESLYKALSGDRSPSFDTILKVIGALGLKLKAKPLKVVSLVPVAVRLSDGEHEEQTINYFDHYEAFNGSAAFYFRYSS